MQAPLVCNSFTSATKYSGKVTYEEEADVLDTEFVVGVDDFDEYKEEGIEGYARVHEPCAVFGYGDYRRTGRKSTDRSSNAA